MYKVTLYQRANYPNGGQVLLDTSSGINPGVVAAVCEPKLNEAGSFTFTIAKRHPLYDSIAAMETYVSVEEDEEEIFYGRIIMIQKNRIGGIKQVTCEGAFAFLLDYEMDADAEETTYTAAAYFQRCIDAFNAGIGTDPARHIGVGTINISGASESKAYKNGSVSQVQSVLRSKLMNAYDGFVRIRRNGTDHLIDWLSQVGADNPQTIAIAQNVISQNTNESGEDIFTLIRPQGNDKIRIDPIPLSQDMLNRYGRIIRTVNFDANNEADLRTKALAYIAKLQDRLSLTGDIGFVDMQYLDGTSPRVITGDVFTHITGYEGTRFTAESVKRDLLNPANDKVSLKTDKDLMNTANSNGANSGSSAVGGAGGGAGRSLSGGGSKWYKFIHETDEDLFLAAKNIEISAQEKIALNAREIANNAESISNVSAEVESQGEKWTSLEGTGLYQNREAITAVAGKFKVDNQGKLVLKEGTEFRVSADGTSTNVGRLIFEQDNRVGDVGQLLLGYQGSYTYQHDNEIGGLVGAYETNTYRDPTTPFKEITPSAGANPKELGYYEKNGDNYVKTNDETAVAGKKYNVSNDITEVIFKGGGGYKIRRNGVEYGVYDEDSLSGGVIVDKLNDGSTTTKIKGTRVIIGEDLTDEDLSSWAADTTGLIAKKATIKDLEAVEARVDTLEADTITTTMLSGSVMDAYYLNIKNGILIENGATMIVVGGISVPSSGLTISSGTDTIHPTDFVIDVQIASAGTNEYKLQYKTAFDNGWTDSDGLTFSRAITSNTWSWSGGSAKVVLQPQNQTFYSPAIDAIQQNGSATWDADKKGFSVNIDVDDSQGTTVFSDSLRFPATTAWNDGYAKGSPSSGTAGARQTGVTSNVHTFTITRADGTTKDILINCDSIYSLARTGYTLGTFTPATVTPQGTEHKLTPISGTAIKLGTKASITPISGSAVSVFKLKDGKTTNWITPVTNGRYLTPCGDYFSGRKRGSSCNVTKQGSAGPKLKKWGSGTLYPNPNGTGGMNKTWYYEDSGGTQYYNGGSSTSGHYYDGGEYEGYAAGTAVFVYDAGTKKNCYLVDDVETASLYAAGSPGNYYPESSSGTAYYAAGTELTLYNAGTEDSSTYYTRS